MKIFSLLLLLCSTEAFTQSSFVSPSPSPLPEVPTLVTKLRLPQNLNKENSKLTAGDIIALDVQVPLELTDAVTSIAESLKTGPMSWGDGRILSLTDSSNAAVSGKIVTISVTCYKPGICKFPGVYFMKDGKSVAISEAKEMEYASVGKDEKEPELYGPLGPSLPIKLLIAVIVIAVIFAVAVYLLLRRYLAKRRPKIAPLASMQSPMPPLEELAKSLRELASLRHVEEKRYKPYYFGMSECLKHFLGRTFGFNAEDRTTREIAHELSVSHAATKELAAEWVNLFDEMDIVKFTDLPPQSRDAEALMSRTLELARRSTPPAVMTVAK